MAQNVSIPSNPLQPGPLYFLCPFKVAIFGVMNDTAKIQHNFLIPEDRDAGKGANAIISMIHFFLENFSLGEEHVHFHADNCRGQNKNNYVMFYFLWRVNRKLNKSITLSFMPVGHTKFHCNWAFGLVKQKYKRSEVSSMQDMCHVVTESTPKTKLNKAVDLSREDVPFYEWQQYFEGLKWKKIPAISKQANFIFHSNRLNEIATQLHSGENEEITYHRIFDDKVDSSLRFPERYSREKFGLSEERQLYLYKHIRPYVREDQKDVLCPKLPSYEQVEQQQNDGEENNLKPKRGRPKKEPEDAPEKLKRGRPKKEPEDAPEKPKRGRPKKPKI
ncbi:hypothetical protein V9T40_000511 [Parthenolecanium corni]|uniref:DUF7869 domain-containing protein n=1 Tax=Parthenolecanium corni TaxID=536013 RepID=A0AAN9Y0I5_9HEMI